MANTNYVKVTKCGITRQIRKVELFDFQKRGWIAEGQKKPVDADSLVKELAKSKAELDKAQAELAKAAAEVKTLTAEKAELKAELDKAQAELAKVKK